MKTLHEYFLTRHTPVGRLDLKLHPQEVAILKVLFAKPENVLSCWEDLWQVIDDYETAEFSCKELMPIAVRKMQLCAKQEVWTKATGNNYNFLIGLPRYSWTKNQYVINKTKSVSAILHKAGIEFIAIKGVSEILDNKETGMMRTSRDIDLLIKREDLVQSAAILAQHGWTITAPINEINTLLLLAHNFDHADGIIDLDLHIAAFSEFSKSLDTYSKLVWERKTAVTEQGLTVFVPSLEDRLIIAVVNVFNYLEWQKKQHCKYMYDVFRISKQMTEDQLAACIKQADTLFGIGESMKQILEVVHELGLSDLEIERNGKTCSVKHAKKGATWSLQLNGQYLLSFLFKVKQFNDYSYLMRTSGKFSRIPGFFIHKFMNAASKKVKHWITTKSHKDSPSGKKTKRVVWHVF